MPQLVGQGCEKTKYQIICFQSVTRPQKLGTGIAPYFLRELSINNPCRHFADGGTVGSVNL